MSDERFEHYVLNIAKLDDHHEELTKTMCKVKLLLIDRNFEEARAILAVLFNELKDHYKYEEQLMVGLGYPFVNSHIQEHLRLSALSSLTQKIIDKTTTLNLLEEIIYTHIDTYDRQFAEYISEKHSH